MAEFQEVIQQKNRMCQSIMCCKCDIYLMCGHDLSRCSQFISNNPKMAEEAIMKWAAEHPEPVYPSWWDWLHSINVVPIDLSPDAIMFVKETGLLARIPADTAEKLGIKPK